MFRNLRDASIESVFIDSDMNMNFVEQKYWDADWLKMIFTRFFRFLCGDESLALNYDQKSRNHFSGLFFNHLKCEYFIAIGYPFS
jgi:hypothetical protein